MIVKEITAQQTYDIRKKVLRENIPLPYEFNGDLDEDTLHLGAFLNEELIGVASFMKVQLDGYSGMHYQLRGMATLSEYQGKGSGRALLESADTILKEKGCSMIWCNARVVALKFYQKNGYEIIGDEFEIKFVGPHFKMIKTI